MSDPRPRVLMVNSGILGHKAVARLLTTITATHPAFDADSINLSDALTLRDRIVRRALGVQLAPSVGRAANLDFRRWRLELNVGLLAARRIRQAERREGFHLIHFHPQATAYASLARMRRTPSIVSIDATQRPAMGEATSGLARSSYRAGIVHDGAVFRAASRIISTSAWAARDLEALYPDLAVKLLVMPYPVDAGAFDPAWIDERAARATLKPRAAVRALFVGGDFPRKGGFDLLEAWRSLGLVAAAELDVVTDWPIRPDDIPEGVNLIRGVAPYTPRWRELWRRADLFVMPTRQEAFGMVFQEAAAAGLPSIGTRLNAIPEIIEHDVTGLLVAPGASAALARAIRVLVESHELRRRMGAAARSRMLKTADPGAYASALGDLVRSLTEAHAGRPS